MGVIMVKTTKLQRVALKRLWLRDPSRTYRNLRVNVQGTFGCDGAVVIRWNNMWLCIETDGYTHS